MGALRLGDIHFLNHIIGILHRALNCECELHAVFGKNCLEGNRLKGLAPSFNSASQVTKTSSLLQVGSTELCPSLPALSVAATAAFLVLLAAATLPGSAEAYVLRGCYGQTDSPNFDVGKCRYGWEGDACGRHVSKIGISSSWSENCSKLKDQTSCLLQYLIGSSFDPQEMCQCNNLR